MFTNITDVSGGCWQLIGSSPGDAEIDFVGSSWTVRFSAGGRDETQSATFTVRDTGLPLPDRKYTVKLRVSSGDAVISQLGIASVTLVASNDPFGVFGFSPVCEFTVNPFITTIFW